MGTVARYVPSDWAYANAVDLYVDALILDSVGVLRYSEGD